jgi:multidrug efflux pump subunit AcrB
VLVQGGQEPEFQITPDPAKLLAAGVTVNDILDAVKRTNLIDSPGLIEQNHQLFLGLVDAQVHDPAQLGQIVVKYTQAGVPVKVADVAAVAPGVKPVYTVVTANGKPAVLLSVNRQPDSNTVAVADEVHAEIERIRQSLPPGIHLEPFYDQSGVVVDSIHSVRDAILIGVILASLIMVLFLRDWGASIVAVLVIPATVLITFIALKVLDQSFNLMTLGGLAAAVGLIIDDAIVVVENVALHRDAGQGRLQAIQSALGEITVPLVGSTITPIVVFLPLIAITGVTGVFFRALAITVGASLLTSLALALTWTPTLSQYFIRGRHGEAAAAPTDLNDNEKLMAAEEATITGRFRRVVDFYERWLRFALERPKWMAVFAGVVIAAAVVAFLSLGTDLLPAMDEGGFIVDYFSPAGSSLQETNRMISHVEQMLREIPEVESSSRRTGLELGLAAVTEANRGDIAVKLKA